MNPPIAQSLPIHRQIMAKSLLIAMLMAMDMAMGGGNVGEADVMVNGVSVGKAFHIRRRPYIICLSLFNLLRC